MKMIPVLKCKDMQAAVAFYTGVLEQLKYPELSLDDFVVNLVNGEAEFWLTSLEGDRRPGFTVYVRVDDVDSPFEKYKIRGLDTPHKEGSPVHQGPVNKSRRMRGFYVTDADGNTLRFCNPPA